MALVQKTFADIITFTRASGGGRFNAAGVYEWLGNNAPRLDYDPVTLQPRGLLVEEQRTNLVPYSDVSAGSWAGGGDRTINSDTGLTGVFAKGVKLLHGGVGVTTYNYYQQIAPTAGITYSFSIFVRYEDGRDVIAEFGAPGVQNSPLNPFVVVTNGGATAIAGYTVTNQGGGLYKITRTVTPTDSVTRGWGILIRDNHKAGLPALYATGWQIEVGSFPTSYIPTTTAQVTRAADIASVNTLSPWYNSAAGNWQIRAQGSVGLPLLTAGTAVITADDAGVKDYELAYTTDQSATSVSIGTGHIESIKYYPRAIV